MEVFKIHRARIINNKDMPNYIHNYRRFLIEQDLGMGMPPIPGAGAPPKKEKPVLFIFIDDKDNEELKRKKYPDGSSEVDFPTYSVLPSQITDWCSKNILPNEKNNLSDSVVELRRKNLVDIVKGDKLNIGDDDIPFIQKLKNAVSTDIFGKREPDTTVVFTKDMEPTTEDITVTFIKYKK
jgi:hypothetical protein